MANSYSFRMSKPVRLSMVWQGGGRGNAHAGLHVWAKHRQSQRWQCGTHATCAARWWWWWWRWWRWWRGWGTLKHSRHLGGQHAHDGALVLDGAGGSDPHSHTGLLAGVLKDLQCARSLCNKATPTNSSHSEHTRVQEEKSCDRQQAVERDTGGGGAGSGKGGRTMRTCSRSLAATNACVFCRQSVQYRLRARRVERPLAAGEDRGGGNAGVPAARPRPPLACRPPGVPTACAAGAAG